LDCGNRTFEKTIAAVAGTCLAAGEVHEEALALCQCLLYYGEGPLKDQSNGAAIVSRMLGPLQRVLRLVRRCEVVLTTALDQLAALTNSLETKGGIFASAPPDIHFQPLIDGIADVLLSLITIQVKILRFLSRY
jgi:WASH complex subunit 7, N-terminal